MSDEPTEVDSHLTMFEDWNERDGKIYYRWRMDGETEWHEKLTAYKEKPYIHYKLLTQEEFNERLLWLEDNLKNKLGADWN